MDDNVRKPCIQYKVGGAGPKILKNFGHSLLLEGCPSPHLALEVPPRILLLLSLTLTMV